MFLSFSQTSVPEKQSSTVEDNSLLTFEDRRKQNFEAGRMELERRKKMLQEQQEKAAVSSIKLVASSLRRRFIDF